MKLPSPLTCATVTSNAGSPPSPDPFHEQTLGSERVYSGRVLGLRVDDIRLADGATVQREIVDHADSVVILAMDADGHIAFVRQWRTPAGRALLELPAGGIDPGETAEAAAARELQEEAGWRPGRLEPLARFYISPGWTTEYMYGFLAWECTPAQLPADPDERIEVRHHTLAQAMDLAARGEIEDAKTLLMLQALALRAVGPLGEKVVRFYRGEERRLRGK